MWAALFIAGIIVMFIGALLIVYSNLRGTDESMKITTDLQDERYKKCLEGWEKANQSVKEVISLNDQLIEINKQLCSKLYGNEDDDNNECE